MDWDKLRIFYGVAQAGSFTKAGEATGLSQSAVSRQISALEEDLQVTLFLRHARGLLLTEQGDILFRTVAEVMSRLAATQSALQESKDRPKGPLKITAPMTLGTTWLTPHMAEFIELYPEIAVTLIVDDRELDLSMREADVALRLAPARQPDLIQRHVVTLHNSVFASNEYLRRFGVPGNVADLSRHRLIGFAEDARLPFAEVNWLFEGSGKNSGSVRTEPRKASFKVNNLFAMMRAVETGLGIATLPDYMAHDHPSLTRILPEMKGPETEVYFVYPGELRHSKRINVFREFIIRKLSEMRF